ncbi:Gp138 family membrane-puncturing spike protein [Stenotrophomonas sp. TWI143]|uniref:Gp138 family membrane-puncturing spike protein n=1 Tax=Stenotrophomonas sp. TWI143 TaxID=3136771 RepID=UPI003208198E
MSQASDLRRLIATELAEVHTCLPGKIVSFDGHAAVVEPALSKALSSGEALVAPRIVSVPVHFPRGMAGQATISVPLAAGDDVTLHFSERALENWLSGEDGEPGDPRMFDLSDAFATPVCRPGVQKVDTENLVVQFGSASITISPAGDITITASGAANISAPAGLTIDADVLLRGKLEATGDVTAGGVSLIEHITTGVTPGTGTSGKPQK